MATIDQEKAFQLLQSVFEQYEIPCLLGNIEVLEQKIRNNEPTHCPDNFVRWLGDKWVDISNQSLDQISFQDSRGGGLVLNFLAIHQGYESLDEYLESSTDKKIERKRKQQSTFLKWIKAPSNFQYNLKARIIPGLLAVIPLIGADIYLLFLQPVRFIAYFIVILTVCILFGYYLSERIATMGRDLQKRYFPPEYGSPTEYLLLMSKNGPIANPTKEEFRKKVFERYQTELPGLENEIADLPNAIEEIKAQILKLRQEYMFNPLVFASNVSFGYIRNTKPAALWAIGFAGCVSVMGIVLREYPLAIGELAIGIVFLGQLVNHKQATISAGERYAEQLISAFITDNK